MRKSIPGIRTTNVQEIQISRKGVYVWVMPDGKPIMNENADVLNVQCEQGDLVAISDLRKKALYWGGEDAKDGRPEFIAGVRRVSEEELFNQINEVEGAKY